MMNRSYRLLLFVLGFAALGVLLSGYLSYRNYFSAGCSQGPLSRIVTCGGPKAVKIFGQPTCLYGLGMFLAVFVTALVGLMKQPTRGLALTLVLLGIAGTAFSSFLSVYEIWFLNINLSALPACIYGLAFYLSILFSSIVFFRQYKLGGAASSPTQVM